MAGKGSRRRPKNITDAEWDARWQEAFGKSRCTRCRGVGDVVETDPELGAELGVRYSCPACGGSGLGKEILSACPEPK